MLLALCVGIMSCPGFGPILTVARTPTNTYQPPTTSRKMARYTHRNNKLDVEQTWWPASASTSAGVPCVWSGDVDREVEKVHIICSHHRSSNSAVFRSGYGTCESKEGRHPELD